MRRVIVLAAIAGCSWPAETTPVAHVRLGPAHAAPPRVLVALPVACVACTPRELGAVAGATRMELEYRGFRVFDAALVNAEARRRFTRMTEGDGGDSREVRREGGLGWAEISPAQRSDLLRELGAQGVVRTSITRLASPAGDQEVTVRLEIARLDGALVWSADCTSTTDPYTEVWRSIEQAARCASESGALW